MSVYCVGATYGPLPDWRRFVKAPSAPSNYKDPAKIDAYVAAAWEKLEESAVRQPLSGGFNSVCVMRKTADIDKPWTCIIPKPNEPVLDRFIDPDLIVCIDVKAFLRLAVMEYCIIKGRLAEQHKWACVGDFGRPLLEEKSTVQLVDPVRALTGLSIDEVSLDGLNSRFLLDVGGTIDLATADGLCRFTILLATRLGI